MKDFFISYNSVDRQWAEWIAWQLESAGYTTVFQAKDFLSGENLVLRMDEAVKDTRSTIIVLSPDFLISRFTQAEWTAAFRNVLQGKDRKLIPVRIKACEPEDLLGTIIYIDLVGLEETEAKDKLLSGVERELIRWEEQPDFPASARHAISNPPRFPGPGTLPPIWKVLHHRNPNFTGREKLLQELNHLFKS